MSAGALRFGCIEILLTFLRVLPFPCKTGLVRLGTPTRSSPVFLTGNFLLTVERVKRALEGIDAYLLVANSRGVNVWCAATGGLLTHHDVVSVLKTSGIEALVDHRRVILPQLAATGIEGKVIHERAGWKILWGPVNAAAIPEFLRGGMETVPEMRTVDFPWRERLEMAVAWAFPISLLALLAAPLWPEGAWSLTALVWICSVLLFLGFPLYAPYLESRGGSAGSAAWNLRALRLPLLLSLAVALALVGYAALADGVSWGFALRWSLASLVVLLVLGLDLAGSTPMYKSGLHEDRLLRIELDALRCKGAGFCERVCPKDVFEVDHRRRLATLPRVDACVQCGACIVQCPFDALFFRSPTGGVVAPETVRRFKLNLLGAREIDAAMSGQKRQAERGRR